MTKKERIKAYKKAKMFYRDGLHKIYGCGLCFAMSWVKDRCVSYYTGYSWTKDWWSKSCIKDDFPELYNQGRPKHDWHDDSIESINERLQMLDKAIDIIELSK